MVTRLCQGRYGVSVLDADVLGHRSYSKGTPCYRQLLKTFGEEIVGEDGQINRRALGRIVFSSPQERNRLEGIVWPEIRRLMEEDLRALGETGIHAAVVEAAVMLEAGWEDAMDEVWVVAVEPE
ncbi:dephospho-CoA kinase, partial [Nannochloropsis gaditana CCMP526]|uniref:dephospho-CoA kinase n=1 Tax=Nannochloropsis gaditana (strain CCMP526) TaxID=1093141 RepID=UPI00029F7D7E